jgi:hypothetical protein
LIRLYLFILQGTHKGYKYSQLIKRVHNEGKGGLGGIFVFLIKGDFLMTTQPPPLITQKKYIYQLIDNFPSDRLAEISLFLEQLLKVINTNVVNQSGESVSNPSPPAQEHPWLQFAGMFADDPDWEEFQVAIEENRRELDEMEGVL